MEELKQRWLGLGDPEADNDAKLQRKLTQAIEKYEKRRARYAKKAAAKPEQKATPAASEESAPAPCPGPSGGRVGEGARQ